ncbi:MAG: hypothetical protein ABUR63_02485 [Verrucomicrobiota bacterium]
MNGILAIVVAVLVLGACGTWQAGPAVAGASVAAGTGAVRTDDSDPPALIPAGVQTVIDVDMAAVRGSKWAAPLIDAADPRARSAQVDALGYDDVADVDRIVYAVTAAGADAPTLVIAQGRFQMARVEDAFRARWPAAVVDRWRGIPVLTSGENAWAGLTPRTFVSGAPAAVRATIDRAFGVGADIEADAALGPVRRALRSEGGAARPAMLAMVVVSDAVRARAGDFVPLPRELRQVGVRVDLGQALGLQALGFLEDREAAAALGRRLSALLGDPATRLGLRALGLGALLAETRVTVEGARVRVRAAVPDEQRAELTAAVSALIKAVGGGTGASGLRSW